MKDAHALVSACVIRCRARLERKPRCSGFVGMRFAELVKRTHYHLETHMTFLSKALVGALMAATIPLHAGSVAAAPLSQPLALNSADVGMIDHVQYRRWHRGGRWIGPAAGIAAGLAIGGAIASSAYNDGYYAYSAAPGYVEPGYAYGAPYYGAPTYRTDSWIRSTPQYSRCTGDKSTDGGYPSWACR